MVGVPDQKNHVIVMDIITVSRFDHRQDGFAAALGHHLLLVLGVLVTLHLLDVVMNQDMVNTIEAGTLPVVIIVPEIAAMITVSVVHHQAVVDVVLHRMWPEERNG
jgi:hypothetical protein